MISLLEKFGKVEKVEQNGDTFHIKITTGFDNKLDNTMKLFGVILDELPRFPMIETMVTDKDLFLLVLKTRDEVTTPTKL